MKRADRKVDEGCTKRGVLLRNLGKLRRAKALTQRELGERAGVSSGTVWRLETLRRGAYSVTARKLARALDVSPDILLREHHPGREEHIDG